VLLLGTLQLAMTGAQDSSLGIC